MLLQAENSQLIVIDVQERLSAAMHGADGMIRNCGLLIDAAKVLDMPITISEQYPQGLGPTVPVLAEKAKGVEALAKVEFSLMRNDRISEALRANAKPQLVLGGIEAHVCVLQTAMEAKAAGYEVFVAADATASRREASKETGMQRLLAAGVNVITTEMAIFEWIGSASSPNFKALSKLVR